MGRAATCLAGLAAAGTLAAAGSAATWSAAGQGDGYGRAKEIQPASLPAPAVVVAKKKMTVTWTAASFADGGPVGGYVVHRYPAAGGAAAQVRGSCAGQVLALTCTEPSVAAGTWVYTATPALGAWTGAESGPSVPVTVS